MAIETDEQMKARCAAERDAAMFKKYNADRTLAVFVVHYPQRERFTAIYRDEECGQTIGVTHCLTYERALAEAEMWSSKF